MGDSKNAFTEIEEAFFRAGSEMDQQARTENFDDLDEGYERKPIWRRLFGRKGSQQ